MTATARALLHAHRWPGNIRELDNVIAVAAALSDSGIIDCDDLPDYLAPGDLAGDDEAAGLRAALVACNWNVSEAARRLGSTAPPSTAASNGWASRHTIDAASVAPATGAATDAATGGL
jgi:DNA-binding NtrC family response regulator